MADKNGSAAPQVQPESVEKIVPPQEMVILPKRVFLTEGVGINADQLTSYEEALRNAGIAPHNIVSVSSILPAGCKKISREDGSRVLVAGQILFVVMAKNQTDEPGRHMAAAIGMAWPADGTQYGYLSEHHSFGQTEAKAGEYAEDIAAKMLASTLGIALDPTKQWDDKEQEYLYTGPNGRLFRARNIARACDGHKDGLWTTIIAAAVFLT